MKVLITTAREDSKPFSDALVYLKHEVHHAPLKMYEAMEEDEFIRDTFEGFDAYENVIHGSLRNVDYFWKQVEKFGKVEALKSKVNFVIDSDTQAFLEERGVPAILPRPKSKGIDVLEFMIRFNRLGTTLYPSGEQTQEEMPGLLEELGVAYNDLVVFKERSLKEDELSNTLIDVTTGDWEAILFHSRSSVNRFFALSPDFDFASKTILALNPTVEGRLAEFGQKEVLMLDSELKNIPS